MMEEKNGTFNYTQWPWIERFEEFPSLYKGNKPWPKVSIIIPSYNQGSFIEETILSVVRQNYPNMELIIIDGGSKDNTVEVIKKYAKHITYWVSEKDNGQSHAINKGWEKATGDWIAWMNSDDCYLEKAFYYLFQEINIEPYDFIYGNYLSGDSLSWHREIKVIDSDKISFAKILRFFYGVDYIIPSQSVFIKKELAKKVGLLNESLHYCMDVEWYARIFLMKPNVFKYSRTICFFRFNENTKTGSLSKKDSVENKMGQEAEKIALNYFKHLNLWERIKFKRLFDFYLMYSKEPHKYENSSLVYLLKILIKHPLKTISDRRLLGLFKRKLIAVKK